jgi:hypothetical protein
VACEPSALESGIFRFVPRVQNGAFRHMTKPTRAKHVAFSLAGLLLVYLVIELFSFSYLSIAEGKPFLFSHYQELRDYLLDPGAFDRPPATRIPLASPNAEVIHPYLGFVVDPTESSGYSEHGFPGEATPITPKTDRNLIVGVFGGSFAEEVATKGRDALTRELRKWLPFNDKEIVVHPVALGGYKQPQQLLAFAYFLALGARFDIVVNIDGFNEVALPGAENAGLVFPFYPRGWPARVNNFIDPRKMELGGALEMLARKDGRLARSFSGFPLGYSMTANLVWRSWHIRLAAERDRTALDLEQHSARREGKPGYLASGPAFNFPTPEAMHEETARLWERCSREMHHLSAANGILYFHFLQPNQYVEGSKVMTRRERRIAWLESHPYRAGVLAGYPHLIRMGAELRRRDVRFHDLTPIFRPYKEALYVDSCCHVNERGYEIVAREIGRVIVAERTSRARD